MRNVLRLSAFPFSIIRDAEASRRAAPLTQPEIRALFNADRNWVGFGSRLPCHSWAVGCCCCRNIVQASPSTGAALHSPTEPTAPSFRVFCSAQVMLSAVHICFGAQEISLWTFDHAMPFFYLVKIAVSDASSAVTVLVISCTANS